MSVVTDNAQVRMDRMYRHQRRIYDATRRYYLLGRNHLRDDLMPPPGGTVLEVGCGTAYNLIGLARRYPQARLHGFDISTEMLSSARQSVERHGAKSAITLAIGDATEFDAHAMFGIADFDRIFTSYTLSMIPGWQAVLSQMARQVSPGGSIHVVDFGDCSGLPKLAKMVLYRWLDTFGVEPRRQLRSAMQNIADTQNFRLQFTPLYRGYAEYGVLIKRR